MIDIKKVEKWLEELSISPDNLVVDHASRVVQPVNWKGTTNVINNNLLIFVQSGRCHCYFKELDLDVSLAPGSLVWIPPGVIRKLENSPSLKQVITWRYRFSAAVRAPVKQPLVCHNCWQVFGQMRMLRDMVSSKNIYLDRQVKLQTVSLFYSLLNRLQVVQSEKVFTLNKMEIIDNYIAEWLLTGISSRELAELVGLTQDYFSRIFRNTYGDSPRSYLRKQKLHMAADMLQETTLTVKEICAALHENDQPNFSRAFSKMFGCSPVSYRSSRTGS